MSNTIDQKVVEMRFDNNQFERNVKTSLSTLEKLKQSLKLESASKGFEKIDNSANKISFEGLLTNVENISKRFSAFGIVGMRVIENLTDGIINLSNTAISFLTDSVIEGGINRAFNIENAHFMLQGLLKDEEKVKEIMDQASESVDGTAYSYDSAAKAASQFAATGLEAGEQMKSSLRAITGVAAMTNSEYESISQIFTTVAGNGRLMGDQLLQLSSRGLNAAATLKDFFNGVLNGSKTASDNVTEAIKSILGNSQSLTDELENQLEYSKQLYAKEYSEKQKAFDIEYNSLSTHLDDEIEAVEKANEEKLNNSTKAYEDDVAAFEKATNEKIALIDSQYTESLKLIDEEKYQKIKAIDDEINEINDKAEAEEKARKKEEREKKRLELVNAINTAKNISEREKAEAALDEFNKKIAREDLAEERKIHIESLKNRKEEIKSEYDLQKENLKNQHDEQIKAIKDDAEIQLSIKKQNYQSEINSLKESHRQQLNAMRQSKKEQLSILKETQSEQLAYYKEAQNQKLNTLKKSLSDQKTALKTGFGDLEVTEKDIRDMVSKGLISFDIFSEAMDDAFGEHAKKANETFTGAMSNIKAALSRIGAEFVSPLIEQNSPVIELLNELRLKINEIKKNIIPFAKSFTSGIKSIASSAKKNLRNLDLTDYFTLFYNNTEILKNVFKGISGIIKPIGKAFKEIFPKSLVTVIAEISGGLKDMTAKIKITDSTSKNINNTFKGLFAVLDIITQAFSALFNNIGPLISPLGSLSSKILSVTGFLGKWIANLDNVIRKNDIFNKSISAIINFVIRAKNAIASFISYLKEKFHIPGIDAIKNSIKELFIMVSAKIKTPALDIINSVLKRIEKRISQIKSAASTAITSIDKMLSEMKVLQIVKAVWNGIKNIAKEITKGISEIIGSIADSLGEGDFNDFIDLLNGGTLVGVGVAILKFVEHVATVVNRAGGMFANVNKILFNVKNTLLTFQAQIKAEIIMKIAKAIAVLTAAVVVLSLIDSEKLSASLGAITVMFGDLMTSMAVYSRLSSKFGGVIKASAAMMSISSSVLILAFALKKVSSIDPKQMATGLAGIAALSGIIVTSAKILSSGEKAIIKGSAGMIAFSVALNIMAEALKKIGVLKLEEIGKGLLGLTTSLFSVVVALKNMPSDAKMVAIGAGLMELATALVIISKALKNIGKLKLDELGKGLFGLTTSLFAISMALSAMPSNIKMVAIGAGLIELATALVIISNALKNIGKLKLDELGKGLFGLTTSLFAISMALTAMPSNAKMITIGAGLIGVSTAMVIISEALVKMGQMGWEEIAKGIVALAGSLAALAAALNFMKNTISGAAALLIASAAIGIFVPAFKKLGDMSWESIIKGLVGIAGAFTVIGTAGLLLGPIVPNILALSASIALVGAGILGIGAGLLAAGLGLQAIAVGIAALGTSLGVSGAAIAAGLSVIILSISETIPTVFKKIGEGLIELLKVVRDGAPVLGDTIKSLLATAVDVLKESIPLIVDGLLELITNALDSLVEYTPQIVDDIFKFVIEVLDGIAKNLPDLIKSVVNVIMAFFKGVADALKNIDVNVLLDGIVGIGIVSAIMLALTGIALLTPGAMAGVLGVGAVIAELTILLTAIGAIKQIPGLQWLVEEGGKMLKSIGTAIGKFIGGLVGGVISEISDQLPKLGNDLSKFMKNIKPFIDGAAKIDAKVMDGVKALAEVILMLTAADILNGLTSWLTGGSSITDFGKELAEFGPYFNSYYYSIKTVDGDIVKTSANAAKALAEMADNLPKKGGVVSWFEGENSLSDFAKELEDFGPAMKKYADSIEGIKPEAVTASANAAKALSEMAGTLPEHGGLIKDWITGDSSLSTFAKELEDFGPAMKKYANSIEGIKPEAVTASANAAKALSEMAGTLPEHGGIIKDWITGDNKLSDFAKELKEFGPAMKEYAESVEGITPESVTASANAAKALSEMAGSLPDHGGIASWITGDNSLEDFANELKKFGPAMKEYSDSVTEIKPDAVTSSANAGKMLAEMANTLPDHGGIGSWFTGDNSLEDFANELKKFGPAMKEYSDSVAGISSDSVTSSSNAAKTLAEMANTLPDHGGIFSWFTGDNSIDEFGKNLVSFGEHFGSYYRFIKEIKPDIITSTTDAAKAVVALQNTLPNDGGWFNDVKTIKDFGNDLAVFGSYFNQYYNSVDVDTAKLSDVLTEIQNLITLANEMNELDTTGMTCFSSGLCQLAQTGIDGFINAFTNAKSRIEEAAKKMIEDFTKAVGEKKESITMSFSLLAGTIIGTIESKKELFENTGKLIIQKISEGIESKSKDAVKSMNTIITAILTTIKSYESSFETVGKQVVVMFIAGIDIQRFPVQNEVISVISFALTGIKNKYADFYNVGSYLVSGFIIGIRSKTEAAKQSAANMATSAANAAKKALDEHSPSKVGEKIGSYFGMGFVNAIKGYNEESFDSGRDVALSAKSGLITAISEISDIVNDNIEMQPTIRPVVDISEVIDSADCINGLFSAQKSISLAGHTSMCINTTLSDSHSGININNVDVLKELNSIKSKVSELSGVISKMTVIMDTGALVGAIAEPMDQALGMRALYSRRGN